MTSETFRTMFPEFRALPETRIQLALSQAAAVLDAAVWGSLLDQGIAYKAAMELCVGPFGQQAQKSSDAQDAPYARAFDRLLAMVHPGWGRVT